MRFGASLSRRGAPASPPLNARLGAAPAGTKPNLFAAGPVVRAAGSIACPGLHHRLCRAEPAVVLPDSPPPTIRTA